MGKGILQVTFQKEKKKERGAKRVTGCNHKAARGAGEVGRCRCKKLQYNVP
jgi:hypothetical protein